MKSAASTEPVGAPGTRPATRAATRAGAVELVATTLSEPPGFTVQGSDPTNYWDAMEREDRDLWERAMCEEIGISGGIWITPVAAASAGVSIWSMGAITI